MRDRLHNEDRRPLISRAMDQLRDLFDGMSSEPKIRHPVDGFFPDHGILPASAVCDQHPLGRVRSEFHPCGCSDGLGTGLPDDRDLFLYPDRGTTRR